jgi:hypothetical protein
MLITAIGMEAFAGAAAGRCARRRRRRRRQRVVNEPRLYQLIRQRGRVDDRTFEITYLDPNLRVYVFTFG